MKKHSISKTLQEEENFDSFYDELKGVTKDEVDEELPAGYMNEAEYRFYGEDVAFMKFHKRTKHNIQQTLQEIIESSK